MKYIYCLVDPRDNQIHYIGKASSRRRPLDHVRSAFLKRDFTPKARWIRALLAAGVRYGVRVLEDVSDPKAINEAEIWWIAYGKAHGWPLTNSTAGGDGLNGVTEEMRKAMSERAKGRRHTDASKEKLRQGKIGKPRPQWVKDKIKLACNKPEAVAKMRAATKGRVFTEEHRARLSEAHKGAIPSPEARARMSAAHRGRRHTEEAKAKISAGKKGKPRPDLATWTKSEAGQEHLARLHELARGRPRPDLEGRIVSAETRAAMSQALKGRVFSEETLARMRAGQQRRRERRRAELSRSDN